jgi:hypothetical protein
LSDPQPSESFRFIRADKIAGVACAPHRRQRFRVPLPDGEPWRVGYNCEETASPFLPSPPADGVIPGFALLSLPVLGIPMAASPQPEEALPV